MGSPRFLKVKFFLTLGNQGVTPGQQWCNLFAHFPDHGVSALQDHLDHSPVHNQVFTATSRNPLFCTPKNNKIYTHSTTSEAPQTSTESADHRVKLPPLHLNKLPLHHGCTEELPQHCLTGFTTDVAHHISLPTSRSLSLSLNFSLISCTIFVPLNYKNTHAQLVLTVGLIIGNIFRVKMRSSDF